MDLRSWSAALLGLALPVECPGCGLPDTPLCAACQGVLRHPVRPVAIPCRRARAPAGDADGPAEAWVGPQYRGAAARVLLSWKERGRHDLAPVLAEVLSCTLLRAAGQGGAGAGWGQQRGRRPGVLVVPVPSTRSARARRGEDCLRRVTLLAAARARAQPSDHPEEAGPPLPLRVLAALGIARSVQDQAGLTAAARRTNLAGAFRLRSGAASVLAGRDCVVVDDIVTTGATVTEAVRVLTGAGAQVIGVAAICATPLRGRLSGERLLD